MYIFIYAAVFVFARPGHAELAERERALTTLPVERENEVPAPGHLLVHAYAHCYTCLPCWGLAPRISHSSATHMATPCYTIIAYSSFSLSPPMAWA